MDNYEQTIIDKLTLGQDLDQEELWYFLLDMEEEVETQYGVKHRNRQDAKTIKKIDDKYYAIDWQCGLTDAEESIVDQQPYEVYPYEYEQIIKVKAWLPVTNKYGGKVYG